MLLKQIHRLLRQEHSGGQGGEAVFMKDTLCARSSAGSDQSVSNWELVGTIIWGMMERWF